MSALMLFGCSGIQSKPTPVPEKETRADLGPSPAPPLPPPPVALVPAPVQPEVEEVVSARAAYAPPVRQKVVMRETSVGEGRPAPASAGVTVICPACPTCPNCPGCPPIPPPEKDGPWGFIAAAFGGAASVIAAAFAKKFLGVSAAEG